MNATRMVLRGHGVFLLSAAGNIAASPKPDDAPSAEHWVVAKGWFKPGGRADHLDAAKKRCVLA
jgi:hypothetical protein